MTLLLNTTEVVMALLTKHQPCTCKALWQQQVGRDRLALTTIKNLLMRLKAHGAVTACGQEGNAYLYQLTGTSPYAPCITCRGKTLQWHLHHGYCKDCRPKTGKGNNSQLDAEFQFLLSPAYQLLNQVLRPWEAI
ncbi:BlaI/MecI/CopY family transcriptional regulator [Vibrio sp. YMD68]|uniref:BlaI/MecI/CopY family transcriptional regulator n=1 Tax=Vibrio sp. YMD68 TaxID=3042300 RepID=UPI00249B5FDF|nr:BlaI/MecI/CopY family transcriptional regulator [Vibrio sp. YMD68]WGW01574.1 BlaI/MecI/CopY family transcriptional regulator [Vibrio sp. YMD68]